MIITTVLVALAAWALLAILKRTTRRAATAWTWTAVAVLVPSLAGPVGGAETGGGTAALLATHLAAAAVLIPGLRRTATAR